jgi:hypothetical protein
VPCVTALGVVWTQDADVHVVTRETPCRAPGTSGITLIDNLIGVAAYKLATSVANPLVGRRGIQHRHRQAGGRDARRCLDFAGAMRCLRTHGADKWYSPAPPRWVDLAERCGPGLTILRCTDFAANTLA